MADDPASERTEEPTPERRRKAREDGQFPRGKDAGNTVAGFAVLVAIGALSKDIVQQLRQFAVQCYSEPYELLRGDPYALLHAVSAVLILIIVPVAAAAALGAIAIGVSEAGFHPNLQLVAPNWERLDPLPRLMQMFMLQDMAVDITLQLARVVVVALVAYLSMKGALPRLMHLGRADLGGGAYEVALAVFRLSLWSSLALGALALMDFLNSFRKHEQSIKMSRQELKDEMKQQEGDHRIKQRQRARAREAAKRGLARAIASSDFVIANPTHISVALRYRIVEGAPIVTAKGYDEVALYIRKLAKEQDIPVIENRPLARALAKRVRQGRAVPVDLYAAVAEILAFVYRLKGRSLDVAGNATRQRRAQAPARPAAKPQRRPGTSPP